MPFLPYLNLKGLVCEMGPLFMYRHCGLLKSRGCPHLSRCPHSPAQLQSSASSHWARFPESHRIPAGEAEKARCAPSWQGDAWPGKGWQGLQVSRRTLSPTRHLSHTSHPILTRGAASRLEFPAGSKSPPGGCVRQPQARQVVHRLEGIGGSSSCPQSHWHLSGNGTSAHWLAQQQLSAVWVRGARKEGFSPHTH